VHSQDPASELGYAGLPRSAVWVVPSASCSSVSSLTSCGFGTSPDAKDVEIAVLRHQLAVLHR
jgi:hypothetical protein